jgi:phosphatidate cytidylyltransferase
MALNKQTFITRTTTAIIFAAVMLVGLLWDHWSFFILFSVIHFGCWWEYLKLTEKIHNTSFHIYTKLGLMLMGYGIMLLFCSNVYSIGGYGLKENFSLPVSLAGFALLLLGIFQKKAIRTKAIVMATAGVLYISLCCGLMMDLRSGLMWLPSDILERISRNEINVSQLLSVSLFEHKGLSLCLLIVLSMWINDTMAYIVGSLIGKTPLSKISPKKTLEGTIGGIVLASLILGFTAIYFVRPLFIKEYPVLIWFGLPLIAAITGTLGDLLESKLKRMAGVKDSGSLMPGHGGFLDRFDSLLLATPFVWLYVQFFMK